MKTLKRVAQFVLLPQRARKNVSHTELPYIRSLWFVTVTKVAAAQTARDGKEAMDSVDATQRKGEERARVNINDGDKNDGSVLVFGAGS